jgi:uncharacterized protein (TIGR03067 family)
MAASVSCEESLCRLALAERFRAAIQCGGFWPTFFSQCAGAERTMKRLLKVALIVGVASIGTIAAEENNVSKADLAKMQGEWSMVSGSADGFAIPDEIRPTAKRVCKGNETTVTFGTQLVMQATFTIDPTKMPKTIDYQATDGPTKGKTHLGIYEIDGDTVKYCFAAPDNARPPDFTSKPGERQTLSVWKRAK